MSKPDARTFGSGSPGDLAKTFRDNVVTEKPPETPSLDGGLTWGTSIHPYDKTGEKRNAAKKPDFHLLGTDLFGDEIKPEVAGKLREKFEFPPFSVLNAREGPWQERKRAWLSVGIQSELGRGITNLDMAHPETTSTIDFYAQKRALEARIGRELTKDEAAEEMQKAGTLHNARKLNADRLIDASPGGSARPAMDYSNRERGDGAGKVIRKESASLNDGLVLKTTTDPYRKPGEDVEGAGSSGTSIFDPVLTELCYRWFCPLGGLILDPFAGGSVRGIVAGLLGYRYHGIDLRPEQIHANEVQRNDIAPNADISWHVGDSNLLLPAAPDADFVFSCPPYGDLEQYSNDPNDLSTMTWEQFCAMYRSIIQKAIARLKPNRFACFVVGEYRDKKTGLYRGFVPATCNAFVDAGAALYNEAILITAVGSLPIRITKQFDASRKLGKTHQNVLVFCKGHPRLACEAIRAGVDSPQAAQVRPVAVSLAPLQDAPTTGPGAPAGLSALAFAFRQAELLPAVPSASEFEPSKPLSEPEMPVLASPQPEYGPFKTEADIPFDPQFFKDYLAVKGHRLLTREEKFFVSEASTLTDVERATIKEHREELIQLAEEWKDEKEAEASQEDEQKGSAQEASDDARNRRSDIAKGLRTSEDRSGELLSAVSLFEQDRPTQTLAQFLGSEPPRADSSYVPDEPPDLTGIDEIVLNFATTGLNWLTGDRPCGVTVSTLDGQLTRFLPFAFAGGNLDEATVKRWAKEQLRNKKITNSKTKFDIHMAREWGIDLEAQGCTFSDVQHTEALLNDHRKRFSLDILAADYFPGEQFALRLDETQHHRFSAEQAAEREKETARLVGRLRAAMYPEIEKQDLRRVQDLEDGVIPAVVEMERNGSPIDMALLEQYGAECNKKHDELMWEISRECGFAFEHTASGWKRLIESFNLPVPDSFSESVLNDVNHPLVRKGQRASQYASLNSKIFKAYPEHIIDGVLRYNINQLASDDGGTVSGRFSIGIVQQVPNEYNHEATFGDELFPRRLFIPGSGDYLEGDAAQIEFRLLVHYSENAKLLQAYRDDPWMSFHKKMQEMLVAYKPDMNYAHTKSYNFAAQYGARSIKLAVMMGFITEKQGNDIRKAKRWDDPRLKTIKEIEAAYARAHPEASGLMDRASHLMKNECDQYCKKGDALHRQYPHRGYIKTMLGRRSRCVHNYKPYIALNRTLQGTGASIMKRKLTELHDARKDTGFIMRITNHDAVLGDASTPETLGKISEILNRQSYQLKVPILWECGIGKNWAEAK